MIKHLLPHLFLLTLIWPTVVGNTKLWSAVTSVASQPLMISCLRGLERPSDQLNLGMGGKVENGALSSCKHFNIGAVQGPTAAT